MSTSVLRLSIPSWTYKIMPRMLHQSTRNGMVARNLSVWYTPTVPPPLPAFRLPKPVTPSQWCFSHEAAVQRRGFFDIHNGVLEGFNNYNILITDVGQKELSHEISEALGTNYLSDVEGPSPVMKDASGVIWGWNNSCLLTLPVCLEQKVKWVHFLLDTGSPRTYISQDVT
jgi:hypothetical protein